MPLYSITLEEFIRLYGDVPEARLMFDMPDDKINNDGGFRARPRPRPGDTDPVTAADNDGPALSSQEAAALRKRVRALLRSNSWKLKMKAMARKCNVCGPRSKGRTSTATRNTEADTLTTNELTDTDDDGWNSQEDICDDDDDDDCDEETGDKRSNSIRKAMRWLGQCLLRHFYFMSVAVESSGGIYMTTYEKSYNGCVTTNIEYCYVSSYACTNPRTTLAY